MTYTNFSIVSSFLSNLENEENELRHSALIQVLQALKVFHVEVIGVYKGKQEKSVILAGPGNKELAQTLAILYNQESYVNWTNNGLLLSQTNDVLLTFNDIQVVEDTTDLEAYTVLPGFGNVVFS